jgi:hypothetical protein
MVRIRCPSFGLALISSSGIIFGHSPRIQFFDFLGPHNVLIFQELAMGWEYSEKTKQLFMDAVRLKIRTELANMARSPAAMPCVSLSG